MDTEESAKRLATVRCFDTQNGNAEVAEATGNDFTTQLLGTWLGTANKCSMKLTFKQGGTFEIESQGHTSVEDGSRPVFASGSGTWAILGGEVVATYNYRGQEEFQTRLPLKIEAPTRLSYEGVIYYKQAIGADAQASQQPRY